MIRRVLLIAILFSTAVAFADELEDAMRLIMSGDISRGIAALTALAEKGNVQAQLFLGHGYQHANPVIKEPDAAVAMRWFLRASGEGSGEASARIADMYASGAGVTKSVEKAGEWWALASKQVGIRRKSMLPASFEDQARAT